MSMESGVACQRCGTCCVAPDISTLNKGVGERCRYLLDNGTCADYDSRPDVCRGYRPDEICSLIAAPGLEQRVTRYLELFGLHEADIDIRQMS